MFAFARVGFQCGKVWRGNIWRLATIMMAGVGAVVATAMPVAAQIIVGGGSGGVIILFGPPIPRLPPLAAFHATIANAGPRTSSGLIIYETPGLIWTCEATNCGSQGRLDRLTMDTCVALGRQVGPLVALEAAGRGFTPDGIAACNAALADHSGPSTIGPPAVTPPDRRSGTGPSRRGTIRFPGQ